MVSRHYLVFLCLVTLLGCVSYIPDSREDRYRWNAAACDKKPNGDECAIKGKHAFYLDRKDEARELWINSCFVHRRPNACAWLHKEFPADYESRRKAELMQKPQKIPASDCSESYESIRWVAQYCLEDERLKNVMDAAVLKCIDKVTGKVFEKDCARAIFFRARWCKIFHMHRVDAGLKLSECLDNPNVVPEGVKNGFQNP